jgi:hypothetical protein
MGGVTPMASSGMTSGRKVDPLSFALSAVELLKTVQTPADITRVFTELNTNTAIGMVNTEAINVPVETPYGLALQTVDPITGAVSLILPTDVQDAVAAFGGLMGGLPGASGSNLLGDSSAVVGGMIQRLADPALVGKLKEKMEKNVSTSSGTDPRKKVNQSSTTFLSNN